MDTLLTLLRWWPVASVITCAIFCVVVGYDRRRRSRDRAWSR